MPKSEWFESWFGETYIALYPHRDEAEAEHVVDLIAASIGDKLVTRVLDLACGGGRHSRVLATRWKTIGLDLSPVLIRLAHREAPEAEYVRGDMRVLPFRPASFSVVVNLFTSFGYFDDDASHLRVVTEVARVTEPGGTFVLDFLNTDHLLDNFVPYDEREIGGMIVEQRREISEDGRYVTKRICIRGREKEYTERVRLFERDDLTRMLESSGFTVEKTFGNYDGTPIGDSSPRMILLGKRR